MSARYTKPADLVERHKQYCFGMFDDQGQQLHEGDVRMLCHVAGIGATYSDERHVAFAEHLVYSRQLNLAGLPTEPLNIGRLGILAGAGQDMMEKLFGQDIEKTEAAIKGGDTLDLSKPETRDEIIERVLADTSDLVAPIAAWFAKDDLNKQHGNKSYGHPMAMDEYIGNFFMAGSPYFVVEFPDAAALCDRINAVLEGHGMKPLPDEMAGPRHDVAGAGHLRVVGGKNAPGLN